MICANNPLRVLCRSPLCINALDGCYADPSLYKLPYRDLMQIKICLRFSTEQFAQTHVWILALHNPSHGRYPDNFTVSLSKHGSSSGCLSALRTGLASASSPDDTSQKTLESGSRHDSPQTLLLPHGQHRTGLGNVGTIASHG